MTLTRVILMPCLAVSAGVHFALAAMQPAPQPVLDGGDVAGEVALGNSFADLVQGQLTAVAPDQTALEPVRPVTAAVQPLEAVQAVPPTRSAVAEPARMSSVPPTQSAASGLVAMAPAAPMARALGTPVEATQPAQTEGLAPTRPETLADALPEDGTAVRVSRRPELRPRVEEVAQAAPAPKPAATPKPKATQKPRQTAQSAPKGNAATSAKAGSASGQAAKARQVSNNAAKSTAKTAGDGAMASYQSKVIRKVQRARARAAGAKGSVYVRLSIAATGQVAGVGVSRSSGNPRVDRAATQMVSASGPFGKPPNGRAVAYVIKVNVRG